MQKTTQHIRSGLIWVGLAGCILAGSYLSTPENLAATPIYSVRAASRCDTCHIEPIGWADPVDIAERKCTLDCQGCHISPSGAGGRTPTGKYYGRQTLPTWGTKPARATDPEKYRNPGTQATTGHYSLFDGFSGWDRGGTTELVDIPDRFGTIDPNPTVDIGADIRVMAYVPDSDDVSVFPMQLEVYGSARPAQHLTLYAAAGLQGRRDRTITDPGGAEEEDFADYFTVRELFASYDRLPYNSYVRAGRFTKSYGWRIPDHTAFQRVGLELDQYSQVFGVEAGINANYPFANVAFFRQGVESWPGEQQRPGYGMTLNAGIRELGWQVGGSAEVLNLRETETVRITAGGWWGLNLYPFVYLGEVDLRTARNPGSNDTQISLFAYHDFNLWLTDGLNADLRYEWVDLDTTTRDDHQHRVSGGLEWNVYSGTQLAVQTRWSLNQKFALKNRDHLLWLHWFF